MNENEEFEFRSRLEAESTSIPKLPKESALGDLTKSIAGAERKLIESGGVIPAITSAVNPLTKEGRKNIGAVGRGYEDITKNVGGGVTDIASAIGYSPEVAAGMGAGTYGLMNVLPMSIGGGAGGAIGKPVLEAGAKGLMKSALKPAAEDIASGKAANAIDLLLKKGVNVSESGVKKLHSEIEELNNQIKSKIESSTEVIDKDRVVRYLDELRDRLIKQVNPQADMKTIKKAWNEFVNHPLIQNTKAIPIKLAQQMKQGTYKEIGGKYGQASSAEIESQKTLARGLKEQISEKLPEVANLNAQETEIYNALDIMEKKALTDMVADPAKMAYLIHNPTYVASSTLGKSSQFKSLLANILNKSKTVAPTATGAGIGSLPVYPQARND